MNIKDRSDGGASAIHHGPSRLSVNDAFAHSDVSDLEGFTASDSQPSQNPHIPPKHESAEVAIIGSNIEPCTASHADKGGEQSDGFTAISPVVASLDKGYVVGARERAHAASSVTHQDHRDLHGGATKCDMEKTVSIGHPVRARSGVPPFARTVSKSTEPVITGNHPDPNDIGAETPVVAKVNQPRASASVGQLQVRQESVKRVLGG